MGAFQTVVKILGTVWGTWSIAAFAIGIFFWIISLIIKKSRPAKFNGEQTYRFFRLAMILAFLLALSSLVMATVKEVFVHPQGPSSAARIQQLTLALKSDDPTQRRHATEALVSYAGKAAPELVKAISEEASVVSANLMNQAASGDLEGLLSNFFGVPPWQTPFMDAASTCLVQIGESSVSPILDQLATDSMEAENILNKGAQRQGHQPSNISEAVGQLKFLQGAAGSGMRISITRDILAKVLHEIGQHAVPNLLEALGSPRLLVRITSYQVLMQTPEAKELMTQRLRQLAANATSTTDRDQYLDAIRQLGN